MISGEPKPRVRAKWQAIIDAQKKSGLDVVEYCRANGLCRSSFYGRRKQLLKAINVKPGFMKLMPSAEAGLFVPSASYEIPVNIRTPNGYEIGLRLSEPNELARILALLKVL